MKPIENIKLKVNPDLHDKLPTKWKKVGNVLIVDLENLADDKKREIAEVYAGELNAKTVIQKNKVSGDLRKPEKVDLLYGTETITEISEYGIKYRLDLSEIMWSPGNTGWRSALTGPEKVNDFYSFDKPRTIIDYFAGIGYFALQMARGYPKARIIAVDKNPKAIEYLTINVKENNIENVEIINDDCRNVKLKADVIHLGYIGNTIDFLEHTHNCLNENGIAVFHEAYRNNWLGFKSRSDWGSIPTKFSDLMKTKGFVVEKFERVKFYGPSTSHIIAILRKN
jgi:tRNA G37 N-methylase Trm5